MPGVSTVAIIGGGPGGYEAALVARQLGAEVTLIDRDGIGGSAVLTDCVPSKALIATADVITDAATSAGLGVLVDGRPPSPELFGVDLAAVNERILDLVRAQSDDIRTRWGDAESAGTFAPGVAVVSATTSLISLFRAR